MQVQQIPSAAACSQRLESEDLLAEAVKRRRRRRSTSLDGWMCGDSHALPVDAALEGDPNHAVHHLIGEVILRAPHCAGVPRGTATTTAIGVALGIADPLARATAQGEPDM